MMSITYDVKICNQECYLKCSYFVGTTNTKIEKKNVNKQNK